MTVAAKYRQNLPPPPQSGIIGAGNPIRRRRKMVYKFESDPTELALGMNSSKLLVITTFWKITKKPQLVFRHIVLAGYFGDYSLF